MDNRTSMELDLEQRFRNDLIHSSEGFLKALKVVYDEVNGDIGRKFLKFLFLMSMVLT